MREFKTIQTHEKSPFLSRWNAALGKIVSEGDLLPGGWALALADGSDMNMPDDDPKVAVIVFQGQELDRVLADEELRQQHIVSAVMIPDHDSLTLERLKAHVMAAVQTIKERVEYQEFLTKALKDALPFTGAAGHIFPRHGIDTVMLRWIGGDSLSEDVSDELVLSPYQEPHPFGYTGVDVEFTIPIGQPVRVRARCVVDASLCPGEGLAMLEWHRSIPIEDLRASDPECAIPSNSINISHREAALLAMNAVGMARYGLIKLAESARALLRRFWTSGGPITQHISFARQAMTREAMTSRSKDNLN